MGDVAVGHYPAVVAYAGLPACSGTAIDGYEFADKSIFSDKSICFFTGEFFILGNEPDGGAFEDATPFTDAGSFAYHDMGADIAAIADFHISFDDRISPNFNLVADLYPRFDDGGGVNG